MVIKRYWKIDSSKRIQEANKKETDRYVSDTAYYEQKTLDFYLLYKLKK
jgi:hypothetical protein